MQLSIVLGCFVCLSLFLQFPFDFLLFTGLCLKLISFLQFNFLNISFQLFLLTDSLSETCILFNSTFLTCPELKCNPTVTELCYSISFSVHILFVSEHDLFSFFFPGHRHIFFLKYFFVKAFFLFLYRVLFEIVLKLI